MSLEEITILLKNTIQESLMASGANIEIIADGVRPFIDLPDFDSLIATEIIADLCVNLRCRTLSIGELFLDTGGRHRTVGEIAIWLHKRVTRLEVS